MPSVFLGLSAGHGRSSAPAITSCIAREAGGIADRGSGGSADDFHALAIATLHGQEPDSCVGACQCAGVDRWPGDKAGEDPRRIGVRLIPTDARGAEGLLLLGSRLRRILTGSWHVRMDDRGWPACSPPAFYETMSSLERFLVSPPPT